MSTYQSIGNVVKPHGVKGAFVCIVQPGLEAAFEEAEMLFFNLDGAYIPHVILEIAPLNGGRFKVLLEGLVDKGAAESLRGRDFYMPEDALPHFATVELIGFKVFVNEGEELGMITQEIDNVTQLLIEVTSKEGDTWLIPLVDEFIVGMDENEPSIHLELPEGLLSI